jgi:YHS domain-containing protein
MRFISLLVLAFLAYLFLKSIVSVAYLYRKKKEAERRIKERQGGEMAEDPVCHTYIPKAAAFQKKIAGEVFYFCGKECAEDYRKRP